MSFPLKLNDSHRRLLTLIRRHQPIARAALGKLSGLGSGPVTQLTRDLLLSGLIYEGERLRGRRGQPALPLMLAPSGAWSFGVSFIPGKFRIVAIDFTGQMVAEATDTMPSEAVEAVAAQIAEHIEHMRRHLKIDDRNRILGVGIALPGFFYEDHAHVHVVHELASWRSESLASVFSAELGLPCWIENDATAAAIAEYYHEPRPAKCLMTLLINYGIGAGIVINGNPLRGGNGNAGEIGAFYPLDKPRPSGTDLLGAMRQAAIDVTALSDIDYENPDHRAVCEHWAGQAANQLGMLIESAWYWLDPDLIIISGALPSALLQQIVAEVAADKIYQRRPGVPHPSVRFSAVGSSVSAIGAAHIAVHAFTGQLFS